MLFDAFFLLLSLIFLWVLDAKVDHDYVRTQCEVQGFDICGVGLVPTED